MPRVRYPQRERRYAGGYGGVEALWNVRRRAWLYFNHASLAVARRSALLWWSVINDSVVDQAGRNMLKCSQTDKAKCISRGRRGPGPRFGGAFFMPDVHQQINKYICLLLLR